MKKTLLTFVALICCIVSWAADDYLHIRTASGWKVLDISQVDKLTFTGGNMVATDKENKTLLSVPSQELETMVVTDDINQPAGIEVVTGDETDVTFKYDAMTRTAVMVKDGQFEIYGINGMVISIIPGVKVGEVIDLKDVHAGIIIIKSGNYSIKVATV